MTADLSSETMEARRKRNTFQVLKEKNCQPRIQKKYQKNPICSKTIRNEGEIKTFSNERKLRIYSQKTYHKRKAKGISINKKEMIKGILENQEESLQTKIWVNIIDFPSLHEFSKLFLTSEAKNMALFNVVRNI